MCVIKFSLNLALRQPMRLRWPTRTSNSGEVDCEFCSSEPSDEFETPPKSDETLSPCPCDSSENVLKTTYKIKHQMTAKTRSISNLPPNAYARSRLNKITE